MEIGPIPQKLNWKVRIIPAIVGSVVYCGTLFLVKHLIFQDTDSIVTYIIQGAIFAILLAFMTPLLNKSSQKFGKNIEPQLSESEFIENEGPASLFKGIIALAGKLFLTDKKIIWKGHKMDFQSGQTEIDYKNIEEIVKRKTAGLVDNGIRIKTTDGKKFDFVVNERETWIVKLKEKTQSSK